MKVPLFAAIAFMSVLSGCSTASGPARISDRAVNKLYDRILSDSSSHEVISPDGKLKLVYRQVHPGVYGSNFGRVTIYGQDGREVASRDLKENGGRLVAIAKWSPDSKFCVFTTISAGGHSPWQFEPYVFSVQDLKFQFIGNSFDAVIDPQLRFESPHTVLFMIREGIIPMSLK
jgi:dipeptidyl aminopeptidase/acylaminoacyl peptidase